MKIGSEVMIMSGPHKNLKGKIIALTDPKQKIKDQNKIMGEEDLDE